ncbi:helix-turn-helix protein [Maribacter vaceletii]|uniref:Helix-turn-helix protein n=1 Tax=Maribacter vaceletii TaxID=1206816 RepID=A0A495ECF5_9FLAO|nr:AraC family transcriptional regulator [Maribacter vaceletii]RKR14309.1 helix-turn-helix protein [Maribacter vaceletii]
MYSILQPLKVNLLHVGFAALDSKWNFTNVISPFSRLYLITSGEAYIYHNNIEFKLKPGYLYLIPSYTYSSYKCNLNHEQYYISFFEETSKGVSVYNLVNFKYQVLANDLDIECFKRLLKINPNSSIVNSDPKTYTKNSILESFNNTNKFLSTSKLMETKALIKYFLSKFIDNEVESKKNIKRNLMEVLNYISENLHEPISVESLAKHCNLSKDYFSRTFKKQYSMGPSQYIQLRRIERAQLLLLTTKDSFLDISLRVGFYNYSYFLKIFKKIVGKTPSDFRKKQISI